MAKRLAIELLFLPSHLPDLNLIGWMWKSTKKRVLRGKHSADFDAFQAAIGACLDRIPRTIGRHSPLV